MKKYRPIGWCKILKDIQDSWCFYNINPDWQIPIRVFMQEQRLNKSNLSFWIQNRIGRL